MATKKAKKRAKTSVHHSIKKLHKAAPKDTLSPDETSDLGALVALMAASGAGQDPGGDSDDNDGFDDSDDDSPF